jgi:hypothetical protein
LNALGQRQRRSHGGDSEIEFPDDNSGALKMLSRAVRMASTIPPMITQLPRITGRARSVLQCSAAASRAGAEVLPPPRLLIHRAFTFYNCEMRKGPQTNAELACVSATLLKMFFA